MFCRLTANILNKQSRTKLSGIAAAKREALAVMAGCPRRVNFDSKSPAAL